MAQVQTSIQAHVTKTWWQLADTLIVRYNDGFYNFGKYFPDKVMVLPFPTEWLRMVGYQDNFYKPGQHWLMPAGPEARDLAKVGVLKSPGIDTSSPAAVTPNTSMLTIMLTGFIAFACGAAFQKFRNPRSDDLSSSYHKL
jgi:hypothetical protein